MSYLSLYLTFFKIGAFSFGGGYAMLPLIEEEVVIIHQWLTHSEFIDIIAISQMSPGPIAINTATFVGYKLFGVPGSIVATLGVVSFSLFIVTIIARAIIRFRQSPIVDKVFSGIRPAVIGLIGAACVSLFQNSIDDLRTLLIGLIALGVLYKTKLHPIAVIFLSGLLGILFYSL
ncbi:Chromate transporter [Alkaliphilus metalliredigens QYMF]|uniref:Chromate transporter n=1 Tax=Alkaliphilus metalliredigens (strain QYMF) TaxID=293826 RepID=A6TM63_ALKMQ|nr:chromate transporter [Alkaliphilus metalliredigens]ABR47281.1 Chromate transporter [Alkaliphilus metalliredigens QYMF]